MKPAKTLASDQNALLKVFGEKVRVERRKLGLSQEELAERCNLDRTYVGGIERGERNPSLKNIYRIARALRVPIHSLFSNSK